MALLCLTSLDRRSEAEYAVLDLLDSGCLRADSHRTVTWASNPEELPSKCPLFPIRKERTDGEHTQTAYRTTVIHQYTPHASGPTVLYS